MFLGNSIASSASLDQGGGIQQSHSQLQQQQQQMTTHLPSLVAAGGSDITTAMMPLMPFAPIGTRGAVLNGCGPSLMSTSSPSSIEGLVGGGGGGGSNGGHSHQQDTSTTTISPLSTGSKGSGSSGSSASSGYASGSGGGGGGSTAVVVSSSGELSGYVGSLNSMPKLETKRSAPGFCCTGAVANSTAEYINPASAVPALYQATMKCTPTATIMPMTPQLHMT